MLALVEVPDYVNHMYASYKKLADTIYALIRDSGTEKRVIANTDIYKYAGKENFIYIVEGYFQLRNEGKLVRWYSSSDFIFSDNDSNRKFLLSSDFATVITIFDKKSFLEAINGNNDLFEKWIILQNMENMINLSLSSAYLKREIKSDLELREYQKGDLIMREGQIPEEIFEMISGSAVAIHNDEEVGRIKEGEVFGEISFLTERTRTATVKATKRSLVRVTGKDDFSDLIRNNPHVIISVSKTLASRIIELNEKVSGQTLFMET